MNSCQIKHQLISLNRLNLALKVNELKHVSTARGNLNRSILLFESQILTDMDNLVEDDDVWSVLTSYLSSAYFSHGRSSGHSPSNASILGSPLLRNTMVCETTVWFRYLHRIVVLFNFRVFNYFP